MKKVSARAPFASCSSYRDKALLSAPGSHGAAMSVTGPDQAGLAHEARDPLAAVPFTLGAQLGMHAG